MDGGQVFKIGRRGSWETIGSITVDICFKKLIYKSFKISLNLTSIFKQYFYLTLENFIQVF